MENLAKAILGVMKDVKGMEKNSRVGTGGSAYDGTKDQDVKEVFNEALVKHGLCMLPIGVDESTQIDRWEEIDQWSKSVPKAMKQKQSVFTKVTTKYLLLHESGESQVLCGYGHGIDPQDKGAGKATTYAMKNTLLLTFLTPVGKIDDTDLTHSNSIDIPVSKEIPRLPALEKENFEASKKGTVNQINTVLKKYRMSPEWRAELETILKKLIDYGTTEKNNTK